MSLGFHSPVAHVLVVQGLCPVDREASIAVIEMSCSVGIIVIDGDSPVNRDALVGGDTTLVVECSTLC